MQDEDRKAVLAQLDEHKLKLLRALADLPCIIDTPSLDRQKTSLEVTRFIVLSFMTLPDLCADQIE